MFSIFYPMISFSSFEVLHQTPQHVCHILEPLQAGQCKSVVFSHISSCQEWLQYWPLSNSFKWPSFPAGGPSEPAVDSELSSSNSENFTHLKKKMPCLFKASTCAPKHRYLISFTDSFFTFESINKNSEMRTDICMQTVARGSQTVLTSK